VLSLEREQRLITSGCGPVLNVYEELVEGLVRKVSAAAAAD
jgi:hypothetical protein